MEQLAITPTNIDYESFAIQTAGRMMEVAMLTKKVKLRLTREQLQVISKIMYGYLQTVQLHEIDDKTIFYLIWELYEGKIRKKMLSLVPEISLSLDLPHAWALMQMVYSIDLSAWPYENNVAIHIISEIDHQTA
jgi:hypothetical protein